jgi:hypothetical protein
MRHAKLKNILGQGLELIAGYDIFRTETITEEVERVNEVEEKKLRRRKKGNEK